MLNIKKIINLLNEISMCLELLDENQFKVRAYKNAIRIFETQNIPEENFTNETLEEIKGIGKAISEKIYSYIKNDKSKYLESLKSNIPEGIFDILKIHGLGIKKVKELWKKLEITNIVELEYACNENRLVSLKGFGEKTQIKVLNEIEKLKRYEGYFLYSEVKKEIERLKDILNNDDNIEHFSIAGAFRRGLNIINDIIFIIKSRIDDLNFNINSDYNIKVYTAKAADFYKLLFRHTGNKEHVENFDITRLEINKEKDIYSSNNIQYIPPELRENKGEIEAAKKNSLPNLVQLSDIKGIFHVHSKYSDGSNTLEELLLTCKEKGYEYFGISEHSKSAYYANGLTLKDIEKQKREIEELNTKYSDFRIFHGIESDILKNGSLDYSDDILNSFDFVIASVHSSFNMTEEEMTSRIIKAVENQYTTMIGHLTGRLLLGREGYKVNVEKVIDACIASNTVIEINSNPRRLDIDWKYIKNAKEKGAVFSVNPDAHSIKGIKHVEFGIITARKGWLEKDDVLNTQPCEMISKTLKKYKG